MMKQTFFISNCKSDSRVLAFTYKLYSMTMCCIIEFKLDFVVPFLPCPANILVSIFLFAKIGINHAVYIFARHVLSSLVSFDSYSKSNLVNITFWSTVQVCE